MNEFGLIDHYFTFSQARPQQLGVGDDAALLAPEPGRQIVLSVDTQVEHRHFPAGIAAGVVAHRAFMSAASDLAAMGADPLGCLLSLTLPKIDARWLEGFSASLKALCARTGLPLLGGDTTRGPLTVGFTVIGSVPVGQALRRDTAMAGEDIWVSGTLGDAAAALASLGEEDRGLHRYYLAPEAQLALGQWLRGKASACIDISDGLVADLGKLLHRSGIGGQIDSRSLPLSQEGLSRYGLEAMCRFALSGGDDYQLCLTAPALMREVLQSSPVPLTRIGQTCAEGGLTCLSLQGRVQPLNYRGFDHFQES